MDQLEAQLSHCFSAIFPHLSEADIPKASFETVKGWDSITTINLVGLIEEEFQIEIDPADLDNLASFQSAVRFLRRVGPRD